MSRDLRKYAKQTNVQLGVGALLVLFIVGDGLIYFIYGKGAAIMGLSCLLIGLAPILIIILLMLLLNWVVKLANRD
ncbi:MAG: hypothetical protein HN855_04535 [Anaerolineae bacterium]|jgi:hypothetical protein|nr:hypothetical protein [Anaerolineae bacterium]MBT7070362.1 hypothetical protein [Anaerolineae bacterium]MBT7324404.1 hypothetical protein [Anaerolineae bacterium]